MKSQPDSTQDTPAPKVFFQSKKIVLLGWVAAISAVGTISAFSLSALSNQQSIAQPTQAAQSTIPLQKQLPQRLEKSQFTRSVAVLKLSIRNQATRQPVLQLNEPQPDRKVTTHRKLNDYVEAISVVFSAIAPQHRVRNSGSEPAVKTPIKEDTVTQSQSTPAAQFQSHSLSAPSAAAQ